MLPDQLDARVTQRRAGIDTTIGARFVEEQTHLRSIDDPFVADATTIAIISRRATTASYEHGNRIDIMVIV